MEGLLSFTFIVVLMVASNQLYYSWADSNSTTTVQQGPNKLQLIDDDTLFHSWNLSNIALGVLEPVFTVYTKDCIYYIAVVLSLNQNFTSDVPVLLFILKLANTFAVFVY